jgi:diadenosine tetraphosphate (Ap4A) HIT family hydrolase
LWIDGAGPHQRLRRAVLTRAGRLLRATGPCAKLNIGALGNLVRQLHVHVVARTEDDAAWPGPVWGSGPMQRLARGARESRLEALRSALAAMPD